VTLEGYSVQARTVEITASKPVTELDLVLHRSVVEKAVLEVLSSPPGAEVTVDGQPSGVTALRGSRSRPARAAWRSPRRVTFPSDVT